MEILKTEGPKIGLFLNASKCEWSWLDDACHAPCPIDQVSLVETSKIQMLGVPLGSVEFNSEFVADRLGVTSQKVMCLSDFDDSQAALYLLRLSFGIVRANHFMRTTPLSQWEQQAAEFDELVRSTAVAIIGAPLPPDAYEQACVSPCRGGLGLRRSSHHANASFNASKFEASVQCGEHWLDMPELYKSQRSASAFIDDAIMERLIAHSSCRDAQRLRRLNSRHANAWITALPSSLDGKDTILEPKIFQTAVSRLLGLPLMCDVTPCPSCEQTLDIHGDHSLCCRKTGDTITRHNRVRNFICDLAEKGMLNPEMEKQGILGPTDSSKRRPGDVSIPLWSHGRGLAIDVAVICPLASSHISQEVPCESYAASSKHGKYDDSFVGSRYDFAAVVFETSGAVNAEGEDVLKQIIRFASKRQRLCHSVFSGRTWTRLSCCIQMCVAQSCLNRLPPVVV